MAEDVKAAPERYANTVLTALNEDGVLAKVLPVTSYENVMLAPAVVSRISDASQLPFSLVAEKTIVLGFDI